MSRIDQPGDSADQPLVINPWGTPEARFAALANRGMAYALYDYGFTPKGFESRADWDSTQYRHIRVGVAETLASFSAGVYGKSGMEKLIEGANIIQYMDASPFDPTGAFGGRLMVVGQGLIVPPAVDLLEPDPYPGKIVTPPGIPSWYAQELEEMRGYKDSDLVVVIFARAATVRSTTARRNTAVSYFAQRPIRKEYVTETVDVRTEPLPFAARPEVLELDESGNPVWAVPSPLAESWRVKNITSLAVKASLFEGANVLEFSRPLDEGDDPNMDIFGNHILVGYKGRVVFSGVLVSPKIDDRKGRTISWTAFSHTFTALKTHLNPQTHRNEWDKMRPINLVNTIANITSTPIRIPPEEQYLLTLPFPDDEGQQNMAYDIATTTPFKALEKIFGALGRFICAGEDGFFYIVSPDTILGGAPVARLENSESHAKFTVRYKYEELAHTYSVSSERRDYASAEVAAMEGFPLPIFQNSQRKLRPQDSIDMASAWGSSGAVFEMAKAFGNALNIDVEVPGWTIPGSEDIWQRGDSVEVRSWPHRLGTANQWERTILGSYVLEYSNNAFKATLGLFLRPMFDSIPIFSMPYMTRTDEDMAFVPLGTVRLPETESKEKQDAD